MERLYKVLNEDGSCFHGGKGAWNLPTQREDGTWEPGAWMPVIRGDLVLCANGYHLCRAQDLFHWFGPGIWEAEYRGDRVDADNKVVVREARLRRRTGWNERTARLFTCDCAERVLSIYEQSFPGDSRVRDCIAVARRYARDEATDRDLAAAWAAASDAASDAAWDAAWAAARAARDAAWDAEREWQVARLLECLDGKAE